MKSLLIFVSASVFSLTTLFGFAEIPGTRLTTKEPSLKAQAAAIVKQFAGTLKPKLVEAVASGGFGHAIDVCAVEAPIIAANLSDQSGWQVKRVSLKPRNSASAAADDFEQRVLTDFERRQAGGESSTTMTYSELVDGDFRFMKAQETETLCLNCHGASISAEVKAALAERYPNDLATGYSLGQIRGAFSLTKPL